MKRMLVGFMAGLMVAPALAEAPKALSIFLNQRPYAGKAIWYKEEVYVPLADMVRNLGGTFSFNHTTGVMNITLGVAPASSIPPSRGEGDVAPTIPATTSATPALVQASFEHQILYSDNAKVSAIFRNNGDVVARNVDVMCLFRNQMHDIIGTSVRNLGVLQPGESRAAEFWLFEPNASQPVASANLGYPTGGGDTPAMNQSALTTINVGTYRTQVQYELKIACQQVALDTSESDTEDRVLLRTDWAGYLKILDAVGDAPAVRLTYDRGSLEIMTTGHEHEKIAELFGDLLKAYMDEIGLAFEAGRAQTFKKKGADRGFEADNCYWVADPRAMVGVHKWDSRRHPPPDLAVEVEISHGLVDRLSIYASTRVPEVWWYRQGQVEILRLAGTEYRSAPASAFLPGLPPTVVEDHLDMLGTRVSSEVRQAFRTWLRRPV